MYRQGDVVLVPTETKPPRTVRLTESLVLAKGEETGHQHILAGKLASWRPFDGAAALFVEALEEATLVHEEHTPLAIQPGVYEVRRQRIYEPQSPAESRWVKD